ncbi:hypothetical protein ABZ695_35330 [Streptomyces sp. NPDC006976]|uniref:hypothetical protein n=1 Tax=Streptomyces sp. NPDC006976 TaxID=3154311 RepID=UPI0033E64D3A
MIGWRGRQEREAARRGAEHEGRKVVLAADWAITLAVRRAGGGPVRVTPEDVLTARLRVRGYG